MSAYICTLSYPAEGQPQLAWKPNEPTLEKPCQPGDTVAFASPDVRSFLTFNVDSPFEATKGPKDYQVPQDVPLSFTVNQRAEKQVFKFVCRPNGVVVHGSGGTVPVGGGEN